MSEPITHEKKRKSREDGEKKKSRKRKVDQVETNGVAEDDQSAEKKREKKRKREQAETSVQEVTPIVEESEKSKKKAKKAKKSKGEQTDTGEVAKEPTPTDEVAPVGEIHEQIEGIIAPLEPQGATEASAAKKTKKSKKNKAEDAGAIAKDSKPTDQIAPVGETHEQDESIVAPLDTVDQPTEEVKTNGASDKKSLKKHKKKSKTPGTTDPPPASTDQPIADGEATQQDQEQIGRKGERFIVFVGNLPFSATKDTITAHFKKVEPADVRLMTHKDTGKPKGFAFLEFEKYDRMRTCLKLYHHSLFDDGAKKGRKINVELT